MQKGYTLVELLVSIGILAIIFAITTVNLSPLPSNTLQNTNLDTLISDIRAQQTLAMTNDSSYGVRLDPTSYTLFTGATYVQGAVGNFVVNLDNGIGLANITFPNSVIVFSPGSGDINGYTVNNDSFILSSSVTGKTSTLKINKYGATY